MKKKLLFLLFTFSFLTIYGQEKWPIDSISKYLEFKYTPPKGYTQTFGELIFKTPDYPKVERNHNAQWIYKDNECIVFLEDGGVAHSIATGFLTLDKSKTEIHDGTYNVIALYLRITKFGEGLPYYKKGRLEEFIKRWPEKKAKEWFNAQHVIEYPDAEKEAIYEGKYRIRRSLCIIKWERDITINFLVTEKGYKNIDKYMKGFKKAFWFND